MKFKFILVFALICSKSAFAKSIHGDWVAETDPNIGVFVTTGEATSNKLLMIFCVEKYKILAVNNGSPLSVNRAKSQGFEYSFDNSEKINRVAELNPNMFGSNFFYDMSIVTPNFITRMQKGNNINIQYRDEISHQDKTASFSLKGFTKAYNEISSKCGPQSVVENSITYTDLINAAKGSNKSLPQRVDPVTRLLKYEAEKPLSLVQSVEVDFKSDKLMGQISREMYSNSANSKYAKQYKQNVCSSAVGGYIRAGVLFKVKVYEKASGQLYNTVLVSSSDCL